MVEVQLDPALNAQIAQVRRFNRFYTQRIGVLGDAYLERPLTLTLARVIFELANRTDVTAADLSRDLTLNAGYLSRILGRLERQGLIARTPSPVDGRQVLLALTAEGHALFERINQRSHDEIAHLLTPIGTADRARMVAAMGAIERLLNGPGTAPDRQGPITLREHRPGDMGWVVQAHGELYAREYGWNSEFEALVAEIVAGFLRGYDPDRERCWIAERDGERIGCVFVVRGSDDVAKLRLLLVTPEARGSGLGRALVREVIRFARGRGYRTLTLWTNDVLTAARTIYTGEGFELRASGQHHSFGHDLVEQTWELTL